MGCEALQRMSSEMLCEKTETKRVAPWGHAVAEFGYVQLWQSRDIIRCEILRISTEWFSDAWAV